MALNAAQKALLDAWSAGQPGFSQGQVDGDPTHDINLGTALANGTVLNDIYRDHIATTNFAIGTPVAENIDGPVFIAPAPGRIVSTYVTLSGEAMSNTSATASAYTVINRRFNSSSTNFAFAVSLQTGVTAGEPLRIPSGSNVALLTLSNSYSVTATANALVINTGNVTSSFANLPGAGDWIVAGSGASLMLGAANANAGLYLVTSVSSTSIGATKQNAVTNPVSVGPAAIVAGDVSNWRLVKATEQTFSTGDVLGVRVGVPAVTTASSLTAQWNVNMRVRYNP